LHFCFSRHIKKYDDKPQLKNSLLLQSHISFTFLPKMTAAINEDQ